MDICWSFGALMLSPEPFNSFNMTIELRIRSVISKVHLWWVVSTSTPVIQLYVMLALICFREYNCLLLLLLHHSYLLFSVLDFSILCSLIILISHWMGIWEHFDSWRSELLHTEKIKQTAPPRTCSYRTAAGGTVWASREMYKLPYRVMYFCR
jgi:hypothetical protein